MSNMTKEEEGKSIPNILEKVEKVTKCARN